MRSINWESAINTRRSTRSFQNINVETEKMNMINSFISDMNMPFEHNVKVKKFKAKYDKKLYTVYNAPPDNLAFMSKTDVYSISAAGFVGEVVILYATSIGISTCWYGHYALAELESVMPHLGQYKNFQNPKWGYGKDEVEGERTICITPLGYRKQDGVRLFDRIQENLISYKRKPIENFLDGDIKKDELSPEILYALELARKAPSAANTQHWRFLISSDQKTISIYMPVGYKHIKWEHPDVDIGICASHFWLGLLMKNINCTVSLTVEDGRAVWRFQIE